MSTAATPRALLLLLAASTEIPLSDSVGLDESLYSQWLDSTPPKLCSDVWPEVLANGMVGMESESGAEELQDVE